MIHPRRMAMGSTHRFRLYILTQADEIYECRSSSESLEHDMGRFNIAGADASPIQAG